MKKLFGFIFSIILSINLVAAYEFTEVRAEHILVKTHKEIIEIQQELSNGRDFEELAKEYSICPSGRYGGDLGYFERGQMVPIFETAAFSMAIGEVSKPVQTRFGWHIIKVLDKR